MGITLGDVGYALCPIGTIGYSLLTGDKTSDIAPRWFPDDGWDPATPEGQRALAIAAVGIVGAVTLLSGGIWYGKTLAETIAHIHAQRLTETMK